jgi:hypothetical protein
LSLAGSLAARSYSDGQVRGRIATFAVIGAMQSSQGSVLGVRWPDDFEIARRERLRQDDELLLLEMT